MAKKKSSPKVKKSPATTGRSGSVKSAVAARRQPAAKKAPAAKKRGLIAKQKAPAAKKRALPAEEKASVAKQKAPAAKKKASVAKKREESQESQGNSSSKRSVANRRPPVGKSAGGESERDGRGVRNKSSRKNIKRIDSEKTHGWQVHVCRGGKLKTKLFSDRLCGGKKAALAEALKERDRLLDAMEKFAKPLWKVKRKARTNTGQLGVSYTEVKGNNGTKRGYVSATVRIETGKAANRKFSVDVLGYEKAVKQAVAWRRKMLRERDARERKTV